MKCSDQPSSIKYPVEFYVARQYPDETVLVRLTATVTDQILVDRLKFRDQLVKAISEWSGTCTTGIQAYLSIGEDFNMGDLLCHLKDSILLATLERFGIHALTAESLAGETNDYWTFDSSIIDNEYRAISGWVPEVAAKIAQAMGYSCDRTKAKELLLEFENESFDEAKILSEQELKTLIDTWLKR